NRHDLCPCYSRLVDHLFNADAGTYDKRVHRSSRPRGAGLPTGSASGALSASAIWRPACRNKARPSAASACRRISRCSASVERPCWAARHFSLAIKSRLDAATALYKASQLAGFAKLFPQTCKADKKDVTYQVLSWGIVQR